MSKTKILAMGAAAQEGKGDIQVTIRGEKVEVVNHAKYLGSILSEDNSMDREVANRISSAAHSFKKLDSIWKDRTLTTAVKMRFYRACILSVLLYLAETWVLTSEQLRRLNTFHMQCLRRILRVRKIDCLSNSEIVNRCCTREIVDLVEERMLRWLGHIGRMKDSRLTSKITFSTLPGKRKPGGQYSSWASRAATLTEKLKYGGFLSGHKHLQSQKWWIACHNRDLWAKMI